MITFPAFSIFVAENAPQFARTAFLLTGDQDRAREVTIEALVGVGRQWSSTRWQQPVDAVLRRLYQNGLDSVAAPRSYSPLAGLPPIGRAALVARYHDGLHPQRAAQICGLWAETLQEETERALEELRAVHPELFAAPAAPAAPGAPGAPPDEASGTEPGAEEARSSAPDKADEREDTDNAPHPDPDPDEADGREHTEDAPLPGVGEAPAPAPWTVPWSSQAAEGHEASTRAAGARQQPEADTAAASGSGAWRAPGEAGPPGHAQEPGLHAALVRLSAVMADISITDVVLRGVRRRKRIRRAVVAAASVGVAASFVVLVVGGLATIAENADLTTATESTNSDEDFGADEKYPDPLLGKLVDPISYAYTGYCDDSGDAEPAKPAPCAQWRLVTASGDEWRLDDARAGYDAKNDVSMPLALSQDGRRVAYLSESGDYTVRDLSTGTIKTINVQSQEIEIKADIVSSPNGRYFAVGFKGSTRAAMLDFTNGETITLNGNGVAAIRDDGWQVVTDTKDVTDVPGHASITTLGLTGFDGHANPAYRIDPSLISHGAALSPDGHTLALITGDGEFVTMDAGTGAVADRTPVLAKEDVLKVERWIGEDKVLVRLWDDDYASLVTVNPRTGRSEAYESETSEDLGYEAPLGALTE